MSTSAGGVGAVAQEDRNKVIESQHGDEEKDGSIGESWGLTKEKGRCWQIDHKD